MAKKKQSKQMMTMAMAAVLAFSTLPVTAYAEDGTSGVLGNVQKLPAGVKPAPSVISPAPGGLGGITPSAPETTPSAPETTPGAPETTPGAPTPSIPGLGGGMPQLKPGFGGETLPEGLKPAPEGVEKLAKAHPDIKIYIGNLDRELNERAYICPFTLFLNIIAICIAVPVPVFPPTNSGIRIRELISTDEVIS